MRLENTNQTTYQWCDSLLNGIEFSLGIGFVCAQTNTINLLVDFGSVMVALLTGSGHTERNSAWMPRANTSYLSQTLVGLARQFGRVPSGCDTLVTATFRYTNSVNHFVLTEHLIDWYLLFQVVTSKLDLVSNGTTVQLNLHDVRLLLTFLQKLHLKLTEKKTLKIFSI